MRALIGLLISLLLTTAAVAGSSTVAVTPGSGATFATTTDGSSNNVNRNTIWDYSAAANGASVDSNHGIIIGGEGTAGTPVGGVISIQGVSSGTAVPISGSVTATGSGNFNVLGTGTAGTAASGVVTVQGIASMTPVQISQTTAANLNATVVGTGTFAVQAAESGTWNITNVSGTVSLPTGAATSALQTTGNTSLATIATNTGAAIPAGTNTIGAVGLAAQTTGGCTPGHLLSAASTNGTNIKSTAGTLCSMTVINTTTTLYYLKLYNTTSTPTCNSSTVIGTFPVPYGASNAGGGVTINLGPYGFAFSSGISFCLTGGIADNDNTNAATGVAISYSFQ